MLDWLEVPLTLAGIKIRELKRFHGAAERSFKSQYAALEAELDRLPPEQWSEDVQDHYIELRDEFESLQHLKTDCAITGLFMAFEAFLRNLLSLLRRIGRPVPVQKPGDRWYLDNMKPLFTQAGVRITEPDDDWRAIKRLQAVRHCITHLEGWPDEDTVTKLKGAKFSVAVGERLRLPPGYFNESVEIVQRSCKRIVDDCKRL